MSQLRVTGPHARLLHYATASGRSACGIEEASLQPANRRQAQRIVNVCTLCARSRLAFTPPPVVPAEATMRSPYTALLVAMLFLVLCGVLAWIIRGPHLS